MVRSFCLSSGAVPDRPPNSQNSRRASLNTSASLQHCSTSQTHVSSATAPHSSASISTTASDFLPHSDTDEHNGDADLHENEDEEEEEEDRDSSPRSSSPTSIQEDEDHNEEEEEEQKRKQEQRMHALARLLVHVDPKFRNRGLKRVENFLSGKSLSSTRSRKRQKALSGTTHQPSTKVTSINGIHTASSSEITSSSSSPSSFSLPLKQFEKVWSTLYYAAWLSDKPLIQRDLFVRLALLQRVLPAYPEKRKFFKAFFLTLKRGWDRLDHIRMNKFLLLERILVAELTSVMLSSLRHSSLRKFVWPMGRFLAVKILVDEREGGRGMSQQLCKCFLVELQENLRHLRSLSQASEQEEVERNSGVDGNQDEKKKKRKDKEKNGPRGVSAGRLRSEEFLALLFPFLYAACYASDPSLLRVIHQQIILGTTPDDVDYKVFKAALFALASLSEIPKENRRLLFQSLEALDQSGASSSEDEGEKEYSTTSSSPSQLSSTSPAVQSLMVQMKDLRRSADLSRLSHSLQKQKARMVSSTRPSSDAILREGLADESYDGGGENEDWENENDEKEGKESSSEEHNNDEDTCSTTESPLRKEKNLKARGTSQKPQMNNEEEELHNGRAKGLSTIWRPSLSSHPLSSSIVDSGVGESSSLPMVGLAEKKKKKRKKEENDNCIVASSFLNDVAGRCQPFSSRQLDILMKNTDEEKQISLDGSNCPLGKEKKKRKLLEKDGILHQEDVLCDSSFISRGSSDKRMDVEEEEESLSCTVSHPLVKSVSPKKTRRPSLLLDHCQSIERKLQSCGMSLGSEMNGVSMVTASPLVCAVSGEPSSSSSFPKGVQDCLFVSSDRKRILGKRGEDRRQLSRLLLGHPSPSPSGMLSVEAEASGIGDVTTTTAGPFTTSSSLSSQQDGNQKQKKKKENELEKQRRRQHQQEGVLSPSSPSSAWVDIGRSHQLSSCKARKETSDNEVFLSTEKLQKSGKTVRHAAGEQETAGEGGGSTRGEQEERPSKAQQSSSSSDSSISTQSSSTKSSSTGSLSTSSTLGSIASADEASSSSSLTPSSGSTEPQASSSSSSSSTSSPEEQQHTDTTGKRGERISKVNLSKKQLRRLEKKQRQRLRKKLFCAAGESTGSSGLYEEDESTEGMEERQGGSHRVSRQSEEGDDDDEVVGRILGLTESEGKEETDVLSVPSLCSIKEKKKKGKKKKKAARGGASEKSLISEESSSKPRPAAKKGVVVTSGGSAVSGKRRVFFDLKKNRITAFNRLQPPCAVSPALENSPGPSRAVSPPPSSVTTSAKTAGGPTSPHLDDGASASCSRSTRCPTLKSILKRSPNAYLPALAEHPHWASSSSSSSPSSLSSRCNSGTTSPRPTSTALKLKKLQKKKSLTAASGPVLALPDGDLTGPSRVPVCPTKKEKRKPHGGSAIALPDSADWGTQGGKETEGQGEIPLGKEGQQTRNKKGGSEDTQAQKVYLKRQEEEEKRDL